MEVIPKNAEGDPVLGSDDLHNIMEWNTKNLEINLSEDTELSIIPTVRIWKSKRDGSFIPSVPETFLERSVAGVWNVACSGVIISVWQAGEAS